jgi:hypothetical protein
MFLRVRWANNVDAQPYEVVINTDMIISFHVLASGHHAITTTDGKVHFLDAESYRKIGTAVKSV